MGHPRGLNDPNPAGACITAALTHLVEDDPSLAAVAALDIGHRADREKPGSVWHTFPYEPEP